MGKDAAEKGRGRRWIGGGREVELSPLATDGEGIQDLGLMGKTEIYRQRLEEIWMESASDGFFSFLHK